MPLKITRDQKGLLVNLVHREMMAHKATLESLVKLALPENKGRPVVEALPDKKVLHTQRELLVLKVLKETWVLQALLEP